MHLAVHDPRQHELAAGVAQRLRSGWRLARAEGRDAPVQNREVAVAHHPVG